MHVPFIYMYLIILEYYLYATSTNRSTKTKYDIINDHCNLKFFTSKKPLLPRYVAPFHLMAPPWFVAAKMESCSSGVMVKQLCRLQCHRWGVVIEVLGGGWWSGWIWSKDFNENLVWTCRYLWNYFLKVCWFEMKVDCPYCTWVFCLRYEVLTLACNSQQKEWKTTPQFHD